MSKKKENYLDYVPRPNALYEWKKNQKGMVEIKVHNRGVINKLAQVFFKKPKYSYIELDEFGTFVWENMDGASSIYEIGVKVRQRFGEQAEPIYGRLAQFVKILHNNHFIAYANKVKGKGQAD